MAAIALATIGITSVSTGNPVSAATFEVTSTANGGAGSLRAAVAQANATPGEDTITFSDTLGPEIKLATEVLITDDLVIQGPGREALTITTEGSAAPANVLDVEGASLSIESLTIRDATDNAIQFGGAGESLVVDDVWITDSHMHAIEVDEAATVTVTNSDLTNDFTDPLLEGDGINAFDVTGAILVENVDATGNQDNFEFNSVGGTITLRDVTSTAASDEAADFQNVGSVVIESSRFDENHDQIDIMGATGSVTVTDTTVSNTEIDDGLEISDVAGNSVVARSTFSFSGNPAPGEGGAGIYVSGPNTPTTVSVVNSTMSGNVNSGLVARPGATVNVRLSTIVDNGEDGISAAGGAVTVQRSILVDNAGTDVDVGAGGSASVSNSLLPSDSDFVGAGNILTDDAMLGALSDNGGPTQTHLPQPGSPAINAAGNPSSAPATDQRGLPRVAGPAIDIGSVEVATTPPPANRGQITISPTTLNVEEGVGTIPVQVIRSGGNDGAVSVQVTSQNLTAAAPGDYVAVDQTVTFAAGDGTSKIVDVTIVDDAKDESDESFKIRLSGVTGGATLGAAAETTITIADDDDDDSGPGDPPPPLDPEVDAAGRFVPLPPFRLFDTRPGESAPGPKGKVGAMQSIDVQITGVGGVPANATAVVMNVTMTESDAAGFVTVWPTGSSRPLASNLNYLSAGVTRPNLVTVPIGAGGKVSLYALGATHLLADVAGYYVDVDTAISDGRFVSVTPSRVFDTRPAEPGAGPKGLIGADETIEVQILGEGGVPSSGVSAVVLNVTATEAGAPGFVTAYPTNVSRPFTSVLNLEAPGDTVANLVIIPIDDDGKLRFYTLQPTHLLADVMGYVTDASAAPTTDGLFVPLQPNRVFDSRPSEPGPGPKGFVGADSSVDFVAADVGSIPADAGAVVLNITATESAGPNFITGWPTGLKRPLASLLNLGTGDTRPNATILAPGFGEQVSLYTLSGSHLLADTFGYYLG